MKIILTKGYCIETDPLCYILKRTRQGKNKKDEAIETEVVIGYYGTLKQAVDKYLYLNHIDGKADLSLNFAEYMDYITKTNNKAVYGILTAIKGEARKPTDVSWIGDADHHAGVCPECKAWVNSEQQHCPGCGQALTWEEVEHGMD